MTILTEGQLQALPDGTLVHVRTYHPDPDEPRYAGPAHVEQIEGGCLLRIGGEDATFCMDVEYTGNAARELDTTDIDGVTLTVSAYAKRKKKQELVSAFSRKVQRDGWNMHGMGSDGHGR